MVASLGLFAASAGAAVNGAGFDFRAMNPADAGCLVRSSFGGVVNNCSTSKEVTASLSVTTTGVHPTSISMFGSNSWCQSVSTNGVGNGANVGAFTWTVAGPQTWQTLNTGDRTVWSWSPVVFRCSLEAGGIIGSYTVG
ncbi:hypothetical protein [Pyxidicoccus trucidator]|uniref:hypothetical protein n=1 Tax=Pyxidicoccus trucidator TaxID=2709662 RepID=UPI0013DC82B5|nr:hypothetical protein [Pyxidicoccus trucidator]